MNAIQECPGRSGTVGNYASSVKGSKVWMLLLLWLLPQYSETCLKRPPRATLNRKKAPNIAKVVIENSSPLSKGDWRPPVLHVCPQNCAG